MKELFQKAKGPFQEWDDVRKWKFVLALLQTLTFKDRIKLICTSLTVDLVQYRRLSAARSDIKPPEAVCSDFCFSHFFAHPNYGRGVADVVFDLNEGFQRYVNWNWSRYKSNPQSWFSTFRVLPSPNMRVTPPMQAADLMAWMANRRYTDGNPRSRWRYLMDMSIIGLPRYHALYGESELVDHPGFYGWPGDQPTSDDAAQVVF